MPNLPNKIEHKDNNEQRHQFDTLMLYNVIANVISIGGTIKPSEKMLKKDEEEKLRFEQPYYIELLSKIDFQPN